MGAAGLVDVVVVVVVVLELPRPKIDLRKMFNYVSWLKLINARLSNR